MQTLARPLTTPRWIRLLLVTQAILAALYSLLLAGVGDSLGLGLDPDSWWPIGLSYAMSAVACCARVARGAGERLPWLLLSVGFAGMAWGFVSWAVLYEGDASPPHPSVTDAGWLVFMAFAFCAFVLLARSERLRAPSRVWLDAASAACAMSAIVAQLLLPHVSKVEGVFDQLTVFSYPVGDLFLVAVVVVVLTLRRWSPGRRWLLIGGAVTLWALGDLAWSILIASGDFSTGTAVDVTWLLASVLGAQAAWSPATPPAPREDGRIAIALPGVFSLAALGLLVYGAISGDLAPLALVLAVLALGAGVLRWSVAVRREAQAGAMRQVADGLARRAGQQAVVAELGRRTIAGDADELMARAAGVASRTLESEHACVLELEPGSGRVLVRAAAGAAAARSPGEASGAALEALVAASLDREGTTLTTGLDSRTEEWAQALAADGFRAALLAPIVGKGGRWGVVAVMSGKPSFADDDRSFLAAVANVVAAALTRAREDDLEGQLQQAQRLESIGQLAGGVAHDFNNILAVILNYADFAADTAVDDQQRRDLQELSKAAMRGSELVKQLLVFSRRRAVDAFPLDVGDVVRDTDAMLRRTIGAHIELRCDLADDLPPVLADPGRLAQVLVNLAVNGRDSMPEGGTLTIITERSAGGTRLIVEDAGSGMDEEVARKAFDPFFTTKPTGSGTGLGLATVYGIVTQAGGSVTIDSKIGRGTRIVMELPETDSNAARPADADIPAPSAGNGETILLVEDDEQVRSVAERILEASGYRVVCASSGERAIEIAARGQTVDLLLSDIVMPGLSGVELTDHLRSIQPGLRALYMSGYTSAVGGADPDARLPALIDKPFTAAQLLSAVQAVLHDAGASRDIVSRP